MHTKARRLTVTPIAVAATMLTAVALLLSPLSAAAHDSLVSSTPGAESTVDVLPTEIVLTFSESLIDDTGATEVVVTDAAGMSVTDGPATVDGAIVTQRLVESGAAGAYHVTWKVVSSDGHPTSGEYSFTASTGAAMTPAASPSTEPTTAPTTAPAHKKSATAKTDSPELAPVIWVLSILAALIVAAVLIRVLSRSRISRRQDDNIAPPSDRVSGRF